MMTAAVCAMSKDDLLALKSAYRDALDRIGEEDYEISLSDGIEKLESAVRSNGELDLVCADIRAPGAIEAIERIRQARESVSIVLIVDEMVSPRVYIKPTILASSLIFSPVQREDAFRVFQELAVTIRGSKQTTEGRFSFAAAGETRLISYDSILYFESRDKRMYLRTRHNEYAFYETLDHLEEILPKQFARCHKSFIANTMFLSGLSLSKGCLWLEGDIEIPVSRTYKPAFKAWKEAAL